MLFRQLMRQMIMIPNPFLKGMVIEAIGRVDADTKPANEPKFVVFYGMLMSLFSLFCFRCILLSGVSISQMFLMLKHMGLSAISVRTYFYHQKQFLFPSVLTHWQKYRSGLIDKLQHMEKTQWSGDGRFDSMGHNAKYGVLDQAVVTASTTRARRNSDVDF
eukprot:gene8584-biopygen6875